MKMKRHFIFPLALVLTILISSCATTGKKTAPQADTKDKEQKQKYRCKNWTVAPDIKDYAPHKVAILPFDMPEKANKKIKRETEKIKTEIEKEKRKRNYEKVTELEEKLTTASLERTVDWDLAEKIRGTFYSAFSDKRFRDIDRYLVDKKLKEAGYLTRREILTAPPQKLGKILDVDALIYGDVLRYQTLYLIVFSSKSVKMSAKMVSVKDGKILWEATHSKTSWIGSVPTSIIGIVVTLFDTLAHLLGRKTITEVAFIMCGQMAETIPDYFVIEEIGPPKIDYFNVEIKPKKERLTTGDSIRATLKGDLYKTAWIRIDGIDRDIYMEEDEKIVGNYKIDYVIQKGDSATKGRIKGFLAAPEDPKILSSTEFPEQITIDTTAPSIPNEITVTNLEKEVALTWKSSPENDLVGYRVYRSNDNLSGYAMLQEVKNPEFHDISVVQGKKYFYKITATDGVANESDFSPTVFGIALKPGPTLISKDISEEVVWYKECSPYKISGPIKIEKTGKLIINPGVVLQAEDGGLIVEGLINAEGSPLMPIVFESVKKKGFPEWGGIFFNRAEPGGVLKNVTVKNAQNGVLVKKCAPLLESCQFIENLTGVAVTENSSPKIQNCKISFNGEDGIIIETSSPTLEGNIITENIRNGIFVKEGSHPVMFHNNIYKNEYFDLFSLSNETIGIDDNFWGEIKENEFYSEIWGAVSLNKYLVKKFPAEESVDIKFRPTVPTTRDEYNKMEEEARFILKTNPQEAREKFLQILAPSNPISSSVFKWLGIVERELNQPAKAIGYIRKALLIEPKDDGLYFLLGKCFVDLNKKDEAIKAFKEAIRINPGYESAKKELEKLETP